MDYYIPISRRLFEHQLWCEERVFSRFEAWLDILQSARFEDTKQLIGNRLIEVKRGQWSTKKVNNFLDLLIQDKMITKETPKETGQTVLTICNYDKYNPKREEEETPRKQEGNTLETPRKQEGNKIKKEKKEKKVEETTAFAVAKKDAATAATLSRKDTFYQSLVPYLSSYSKEMIRAFFNYWSEMNKSGTRMRYELEKTWELPKRLATWASRERMPSKIETGMILTDNSTEKYNTPEERKWEERWKQ